MAEAACETLGRSKRPSVQLVAMQHNRSACLEFLGERSLALVAQCPMPNAQCPMPNAQCSTPEAQCPMPNARCPMRNARCPTPNAQRPMRANTGLTQAQCPMTERNPVPANAAYCIVVEAQCRLVEAQGRLVDAQCRRRPRKAFASRRLCGWARATRSSAGYTRRSRSSPSRPSPKPKPKP